MCAFVILYPNWDCDDVFGFHEQAEVKAFVAGYKQALKDSKTLEMLEMLQSIIQSFECDFVLDDEIVDNPYEWLVEDYKKAKQLIKQATEL